MILIGDVLPHMANRPAQLAELPCSRSDPELFSNMHRKCQDFCDICDISAVFNILQQNVTNFDVRNGERD